MFQNDFQMRPILEGFDFSRFYYSTKHSAASNRRVHWSGSNLGFIAWVVKCLNWKQLKFFWWLEKRFFKKLNWVLQIWLAIVCQSSKLSNMTWMGLRKLKPNSYNLVKNLGPYLPAAISVKFEILRVQIRRQHLQLQHFWGPLKMR